MATIDDLAERLTQARQAELEAIVARKSAEIALGCARSDAAIAERKIAQQKSDAFARRCADDLYAGGMQCNCDLDNWEPEKSTGHSWVCRIHSAATECVRSSSIQTNK